MSEQILLATFEEHIKGYGLVSDLLGKTYHGIPLGEAELYEHIWEVFIEDFDLEPYSLNLTKVPRRTIPRGTLYIYGELKEPTTDDDIARAIGWIKTYTQHSQQHKALPYWDDRGGFMSPAWDGGFNPTTDMHEAMYALEHLIEIEKITEADVCKLICDFIINRKEKS